MRVFKPMPQEGYEWALPNDDGIYDVLVTMAGTRQRDGWSPPGFHLVHEGDSTERSDMPWLGGHTLVVRPNARDALAEAFAGQAEFLPVECSEPLSLVNALQVIDALDEEASEIVRFPSSGRVMKVTRHAFLADTLDGVAIFKLPQLVRGSVYVTEQVVDAYNDAGLVGVEWTPVG